MASTNILNPLVAEDAMTWARRAGHDAGLPALNWSFTPDGLRGRMTDDTPGEQVRDAFAGWCDLWGIDIESADIWVAEYPSGKRELRAYRPGDNTPENVTVTLVADLTDADAAESAASCE